MVVVTYSDTIEPRKHGSAKPRRECKIRWTERHSAASRAQRYTHRLDSIAFPPWSNGQLLITVSSPPLPQYHPETHTRQQRSPSRRHSQRLPRHSLRILPPPHLRRLLHQARRTLRTNPETSFPTSGGHSQGRKPCCHVQKHRGYH